MDITSDDCYSFHFMLKVRLSSITFTHQTLIVGMFFSQNGVNQKSGYVGTPESPEWFFGK